MHWREKYKNKIVSAEEAVKHIHSDDAVVIQQGHGMAQILVDAMVARANELKNVKVMSMINFGNEQYLQPGLEKSFRYYTSFLGDASRTSIGEGRGEYVPCYFSERPNWFRETFKPTVALLMLSSPDENGICSYSLNADYSVAAAELSKMVIAQINPCLPRTYGSYISLDDVDWIVEHKQKMIEKPMGKINDISMNIGKIIAPYIPDGATMQLGIGGVPDAVLSCLTDKEELGVHTELFSTGVIDLFNKGIITNSRKNIDKGKIVATMLIGTKEVFDFVDNNPNVLMKPVDYTNNPYVIAQNDNVVSINSCLQVDLMGQVNSDTVNGKPYSGVGGQVDFIRGANMSKGGQSFLAMPSTAKNDEISRIVCQLDKGTPVTTSRFEVHYIVTEFGAVNLRGQSLNERAKRLISIAHPKFREELTYEARKLGYHI